MRPGFLSDVVYAVAVVLVLTIFAVAGWYIVHPVNEQLATELLGNAIFAVTTILILDSSSFFSVQ